MLDYSRMSQNILEDLSEDERILKYVWQFTAIVSRPFRGHRNILQDLTLREAHRRNGIENRRFEKVIKHTGKFISR